MNLALSNSNFKSNETTTITLFGIAILMQSTGNLACCYSRTIHGYPFTFMGWMTCRTPRQDPHPRCRHTEKLDIKRPERFSASLELVPPGATPSLCLSMSSVSCLVHISPVYIQRSSLGRHTQHSGYLIRNLRCLRPSYSDHGYNINVPEDPDGVRGYRPWPGS
ncbi:hypothetical protein TESG_05047, partial [Trichophyton tonsurans CBS 112818]